MLVGMLLRNFKNYGNYHYVKVTHNALKNLTAYVGVNGVGKSAILEAIDAFFNNPEWNYTKAAKRDDVAITLVFVIEKSRTAHLLNASQKACLQKCSDYFLDDESFKQLNNLKHIQELVRHKNEFLHHIDRETHYFLLIGKSYQEQKKPHFAAFDSSLRSHLTSQDYDPEDDLVAILALIAKLYAYVYIPVEGYAQDFLMLERREMQDLMSKDIAQKIDSTLTDRSLTNTTNAKKTNVIDSVNESLNGFVDEINKKIQKIDTSYSFSVESGKKKNLTTLDVREQIIKSYFNIRTLKKNNKEVSQHSSGEQRKALIDVASAFLDDNVATEKCVILAIDEPDASMHTSSCFEQFERIAQLAEHHQVLLTTHWYGFLPTIQNGNLHHVSMGSNDLPLLTSFDLENYLEDKRVFPEDVELKSYFDFVASVLSLMKVSSSNWIFCEGSDDVNYIKSHFNSKQLSTLNLRIMPLGGIANVVKIYEYLYVPFMENVEKKSLQGKILCLTDTDAIRTSVKFNNCSDNKSLAIRRLQQTANDGVSLEPFEEQGLYTPTSIEDVVYAKCFFGACDNVAQDKKRVDVIAALLIVDVSNQKYASVFSCDTWIDSIQKRDVIRDFVRANKPDIAQEYSKLMATESGVPSLSWVDNIVNFFNPPVKVKEKVSKKSSRN